MSNDNLVIHAKNFGHSRGISIDFGNPLGIGQADLNDASGISHQHTPKRLFELLVEPPPGFFDRFCCDLIAPHKKRFAIEAAELIASNELYPCLVDLRGWWDTDVELLERTIENSKQHFGCDSLRDSD